MKELICAVLNVYLLVLLARAILSFFPIRPGTGLASFQQVLAQLTEPVIAPVRRVIPPAGMFDLSFLVVFIAIEVLLRAIHCPAAL
ncbi:MAG TPA: YggT family protein [Acidimicrobiia bacterium]|nr:YggT family protein [Acidimicrobiia bacterium]